MSKLNGKAKEVLDACLSAESPEVRAKVYEIIDVSGLEPSDPMFLILALTGQMRVFLEVAPAELSQLLADWKEQAFHSLQQIQTALKQVAATRQSEAETMKHTLEGVASDCVENIKAVGIAATSAIAEANQETLFQATQTVTAATKLKDATVTLIEQVDEDRQKNEKVFQIMVRQFNEATTGLNAAIHRNQQMYGAMDKLQAKIRLSTALGSITPLAVIGIAMIAGALLWGWGLHMYWGDSEKYLPVIHRNQAAFEGCFNEDGYMKSGLDCKVVYQKEKVKKKK